MSKLAADRVARHLVAAGRLVDDDPEAALAQARAARALGARVAVVRQATGETAYAAGEWAEAIAELRTARRMTGDNSALPLIADAERALGRPDRALRLAQSPEARSLPPAERVEMRIVEAGARRDLDQLDAALVTLQAAGLDRRAVEPWSARLWYAFADVLLALGRVDEARDWFAAAASADPDGSTDADERVLELDGVEVLADEEDEDLTDEAPPTDAPPTDAPALDGQPVDEQPVDEQPEGAPSADALPVDRQFSDALSDDVLSVDAPPDEQLPGEVPPDEQLPGEVPPLDAPPVDRQFADAPPDEQLRGEVPPLDASPADQQPADGQPDGVPSADAPPDGRATEAPPSAGQPEELPADAPVAHAPPRDVPPPDAPPTDHTAPATALTFSDAAAADHPGPDQSGSSA